MRSLDGTPLYRVSYVDNRPQYKNESAKVYHKRLGKRQWASALYELQDAERLKLHYEKGGLSDVEITRA